MMRVLRWRMLAKNVVYIKVGMSLTHVKTPACMMDLKYALEPSRQSMRVTLSRIMDQVRNLLPTHVATAPLTALRQGKLALTPIHDLTHVDPPRRSGRIRRIHYEQETHRTTYDPNDVTIDIDVRQHTTPPHSTCRTTPTAQQTAHNTVLPPLYDTFCRYMQYWRCGWHPGPFSSVSIWLQPPPPRA